MPSDLEMGQLRKRYAAMELRRRKQINNQIAVINRLLAANGAAWSYDEEMEKLHEQLAEGQATVEELQEELNAARMEG